MEKVELMKLMEEFIDDWNRCMGAAFFGINCYPYSLALNNLFGKKLITYKELTRKIEYFGLNAISGKRKWLYDMVIFDLIEGKYTLTDYIYELGQIVKSEETIDKKKTFASIMRANSLRNIINYTPTKYIDCNIHGKTNSAHFMLYTMENGTIVSRVCDENIFMHLSAETIDKHIDDHFKLVKYNSGVNTIRFDFITNEKDADEEDVDEKEFRIIDTVTNRPEILEFVKKYLNVAKKEGDTKS